MSTERLLVRYPEKNLPNRIRKYVTGIYEYLDSTVDVQKSIYENNIIETKTIIYGGYKINRNLQVYYLLMRHMEDFIKEMAHSEKKQIYFKKTLETPGHKDAFEQLILGNEDWFDKLVPLKEKQSPAYVYHSDVNALDSLLERLGNNKFEFPYLLIYCYDNGFSLFDAMSAVFSHYADKTFYQFLKSIEESEDFAPEIYNNFEELRKLFPEYFPPDNLKTATRREEIENISPNDPFSYYYFISEKEDHVKDYPRTCNTYSFVFGGSTRFPANSRFLLNGENKDKVVFVTEYIHSAIALEKEVIDNYFNYLLDTIGSVSIDFGKQFRTLIGTILPQYYDFPIGDCIWIAPVGGYVFPWYSYWRMLKGCEVYIFKVGEKNPHVYLKELVDVLDAIYQQLKDRPEENKKDRPTEIKFVIFPRKVSTNYKDNEIDILSVEDLFVKCMNNSIPIPETLNKYYSTVIRKRKTQRTSSYIVEPILRKNDWILVTGEEGTGKSFFSMGLGMAIAHNSKMMFPKWKLHRRSLKVLYITDTEMREDIIEQRLKDFKRVYNVSGQEELFFVAREKNIDLTNDKSREDMEKLIAYYTNIGRKEVPVSVVIFDHLLKLTAGKGDKDEYWHDLCEWLNRLTEESKLSIILIHHEFAGTRMHGSRQISYAVGTRIHIENYLDYLDKKINDMPKRRNEEREKLCEKLEKLKTEEKRVNMGVSIQKNRGGEDDREPRYLGLDLKNYSWITDNNDEIQHDNNAERINWKLKTDEEKGELIKRWYEDGMTSQEIADRIGRCKSTVEKEIAALRKAGKLEKSKKHPKQQPTDS